METNFIIWTCCLLKSTISTARIVFGFLVADYHLTWYSMAISSSYLVWNCRIWAIPCQVTSGPQLRHLQFWWNLYRVYIRNLHKVLPKFQLHLLHGWNIRAVFPKVTFFWNWRCMKKFSSLGSHGSWSKRAWTLQLTILKQHFVQNITQINVWKQHWHNFFSNLIKHFVTTVFP